MAVGCKVCEAENRDEQEALGLLCLDGELSWAELGRRLLLKNTKSIYNHMHKHYVQPDGPVEEALGEFQGLVAESIAELILQMRSAPPEVKALYAVAIQNLQGIDQTKPSQQNLINALKGIHEVTGMRMEQRLMLDFARHHFGLAPGVAAAAIEQHADVIDVEPLDDTPR